MSEGKKVVYRVVLPQPVHREDAYREYIRLEGEEQNSEVYMLARRVAIDISMVYGKAILQRKKAGEWTGGWGGKRWTDPRPEVWINPHHFLSGAEVRGEENPQI